jgi:hypothetical protein
MSGGRWDYCGSHLRDILTQIGEDPEVQKRWPLTAEALLVLGEDLYQIEHDMDWDLSCDILIKNDRHFDLQCMRKLTRCVGDFNNEK